MPGCDGSFHMGGRHVQHAHGRRGEMAADGSHLDGAMIALMPSEADAKRLRISGGEKASELHLTLGFLGDDGAAIPELDRMSLTDMIGEALSDYVREPVQARVFGVSHWNGDGNKPCWVYTVGDVGDDRDSESPSLSEVREAVWYAVRSAEDFTHEVPPQHTPWQPHVCAAYTGDLSLAGEMEKRLGPVTFDRVRLAFAGEYTDFPLQSAVTAAAPLRRSLTDLETRSMADFALMDRAWKEAVDALVRDWTGILTAQREEIRKQITAAVDSGEPERLADIDVDTDAGSALLTKSLLRFAQRAGEQQAREVRAQGVRVPEWSIPEEGEAVTAAAGRELLRTIAQTTARALGLGLVGSAIRRAQALISSRRTGRQVADAVDDHLGSLSDASLRDALGAAATIAQNEGRMAVLAVAPVATYVSSEAMDSRACKPCRSIDGTEYDTLAGARADYPTGGYRDCDGFSRCRGTIVAVWPQVPEGS